MRFSVSDRYLISSVCLNEALLRDRTTYNWINIKKPVNLLRFTGFLVPQAGIEPAHLTVHDFESCASTNSATKACFGRANIIEKFTMAILKTNELIIKGLALFSVGEHYNKLFNSRVNDVQSHPQGRF